MRASLKEFWEGSYSRRVSLTLALSFAGILGVSNYLEYRQEKDALVTTVTDHAVVQLELTQPLFAEKVHFARYFELWKEIRRLIGISRKHNTRSTLLEIREIAVLDNEGRVLGHSAPEENALLKAYNGKISRSDTSPGGLGMRWNADKSRLAVTAELRWDNQPVGQLYIIYSTANLKMRLQALQAWHLLLMGGAGALAFVLSIIFTRWVTKPLNSMIPVLWEIGEGNLSLEEFHQRADEFGTLARALEVADSRIHLATREQKQLMSILEATSDVVGMVDVEGRTIFLNAAGRKQLGYGAGEDLSEIRISSYHSGKVARYLVQEALPSAQRDGKWRGETPFLRRDGSEFMTSQVIVAHHGEDGELAGFSTIARDISSEKTVEHKLRHYQANLEQMVKIRTRELEAEKNRAEAASNAKSEFLSRMSHELRTPMNAVLGFSQLLVTDTEEHLSASQRENVQEILDAGEHLLTLINEVLDLSRIDSGRMEISLEKVNLGEVVQASVKLVQMQASSRAVRIISAVSECDDVVVCADFTRLRQVLLNLLSNAVKYNREGGTVTVRCRIVEDALYLDITDTGKGIRDEDLEKLFVPFERLDAKYSVEGTGIGLAISRRLVELMQGTLSVRSSFGEGSTFSVELRLFERCRAEGAEA